MTVVISRRAEADLVQIYANLVTRYDIHAAERFRTRAERALALIGQHPAVGPHPGWATRHTALRFWVISKTNYIIYYEFSQDRISIERVLDGRRDVCRIMESEIEESPDEGN